MAIPLVKKEVCGNLLFTGFVFVLFFLLAGHVSGQDRRVDITARSSFIGSSADTLPFWLYSNKDGMVDPNSPNWLNELNVESTFLNREHFSLQAGTHLAGRYSTTDDYHIHFNRLYLRANFYGFKVTAGRYIDPLGLHYSDLSSGSLMVSRNATPVPRISIATQDFMNVPLTEGHVQYKAMISHGWFESDRFVTSPYLHQKYFYLRVNVGPLSGTGGMIHNVQWGGTHPEWGPMAESFDDFYRTVLGRMSKDMNTTMGNSVAAYDFGLSYENENNKVSLARLFYLEDRVSTRFRSPWDGSWRLKWDFKGNKLISILLYEHINTKRQDAKIGEGEAPGRINYYNHPHYKSGWSYYDDVLGTPLFTYDGQTDKVTNNMVVGHHVGMKGSGGKIRYKALFTYTRNYGINPFKLKNDELINLAERRTDQYSAYLKLSHPLPITKLENFDISLGLSADLGDLYSDRLGLMVGLRWDESVVF